MRILFRSEGYFTFSLKRLFSDNSRSKVKKAVSANPIADDVPPECVKIPIPSIGQSISNVRILANDIDPVVLPDDQYPPWLFDELDRLGHRMANRQIRAGRIDIPIPPSPKISTINALKHKRKSLIKSNNALIKK